jgi:hypothetical protein
MHLPLSVPGALQILLIKRVHTEFIAKMNTYIRRGTKTRLNYVWGEL